MAHNRKFIIVITLLFNLFWLHPLYAMHCTLNPLTWVYALGYKIYYHFGWITPAIAETKINQSYDNLKRFFGEIGLDMVVNNNQFEKKLSQDRDTLQRQFQEAQEHVQKLDFDGLTKFVKLRLMAHQTTQMLKEQNTSIHRNFSHTHEATLIALECITQETALLKKDIEAIHKCNSSLRQKITYKIQDVQHLQNNYHTLQKEKISEIRLQQQEFCAQTKEHLNGFEQTIQHCQEQCEKEKEHISNEGKSIKDLLFLLKESHLKQQKILNKLARQSPSQKPTQPKKVFEFGSVFQSNVIVANTCDTGFI